MRKLAFWMILALSLAAGAADAALHSRGSGHSGSSSHVSGSQFASTSHTYHARAHGAHSHQPSSYAPRKSRRANGVARTARGHIERSARAKDAFRRAHPCPSTERTRGACRGYVIDHLQALKHGGADSPSNMQWQTTAAAKAKDRTE
jgi:hypothetical protein